MNERTVLKHSVNCYFCGELVDERECQNADEFNHDDGGSICPECAEIFEKYDTIKRTAVAIANEAHAGMKRMFSGADFVTHPLAVAKLAAKHGPVAELAAILHDVVEDSKLTYDDLLAAGIPRKIVNVVRYLTRDEGETYFSYIMRIKHGECADAKHVKIADLRHNFNDWPKEGSMRDKYRFAYYVLTGEALL